MSSLARNAGKVLTRARLLQAVWNEPVKDDDRKLTVHMSRLRKKLAASDPWQIETYTKRGYALVNRQQRAGRPRPSWGRAAFNPAHRRCPMTDSRFCPYCATPAESDWIFCQACGKRLPGPPRSGAMDKRDQAVAEAWRRALHHMEIGEVDAAEHAGL